MIDFGRWADEEYSVPATETIPAIDDAEATQEVR
jgi:endogenous inhibitor of DNA gyrase (YacG/DUF329 family)